MTADPYTAVVNAARGALVSAGLERRELDGTVYFIGGNGAETLALVHGVNDQAGTWAAAIPGLSRFYRLIALDLPGHGESGPKEGPISMPLIVERLHAIISREVTLKVALAGSSFGAWISILYALEHPERVSRMYLESGGGLARPPGVPLTASSREEAHRILKAVHGPDTALPDWAADSLIARAKDAPLLRVMASNVFPYFIDARLGEVKVPTTIIWGENDGVVSRAYVDELQRGISGSKLHVISGAAHIPHSQQADRFVSCLTATC